MRCFAFSAGAKRDRTKATVKPRYKVVEFRRNIVRDPSTDLSTAALGGGDPASAIRSPLEGPKRALRNDQCALS
ncbi:hypothetical protein HPB52_018398 [Rhipicephalus sanguineus]|uniref:Uncharacterized protein n=1 Tax=Rhipicephalus sanguineus TaxID=34632 RepID=A0A9D4SV92_RHISA|nr:hypothetical protein HPB52_018398 [Rhipicephalus sanguineus]